MRSRRLSLFTALVIALLASQLIAPASAFNQQAPRRVIEVNENGLVYVYDVLPSDGGAIRVGFPRDLIRNLVNYACEEDHELELVVEGDFFWIVVDGAPSPEIHLLTIFRDIVSWNSIAQTYSLRIPIHPRVKGLSRAEFSVEVRLPKDALIAEISPSLLNQTGPGVLSGTLHDLDLSRENISMVSISFSSESLRLLDVILARLLVEVPDGKVSISLRMRLLGGSRLSEIGLKLPEGFELIGVEDALGKLSSSAGEGGVVAVRLRQPLTEGRSEFFTVIAKAGEGSNPIKLGDREVSIGLLMPLNTTLWTYDVEIRLRGGEIKSWSPEPIELRREYPEKTILVYRFNRIDPLNAGEFRIVVNYERGVSFFQIAPYLALASLILLASSITAIYRSRGKAVEKRPVEGLIDEVISITGIYQRLMGLISSDKIYDRGLARKTLLELRAEVKQRAESIRRMGDELAREEPKAAEQVKELVKAVEDFQHAVERTWSMIYPYLSRSLPRSKLDEALKECRESLRRAYDPIASELEGLKRRLS